ncbi:MAG: ComEC/Rec2 family competence protein [Candidatus Omnitrophica bacterium]|nr:ComEC/Rec2 family competence protein [Candidatus Omnitrophota bacterium]
MKFPLVWLTIFFCVGLGTGNGLSFPVSICFLLLTMSLIFSIALGRLRIIGLVCIMAMAFSLGLTRITLLQLVPKSHFIHLTQPPGDMCQVKGVVINDPVFLRGRTTCVLRVAELSFATVQYRCSGDMLLSVRGIFDVRYGDYLSAVGSIERIPDYGRRFNQHLYRKNIFGLLKIQAPGFVVKYPEKRGNPFMRFAVKVRRALQRALDSNLSARAAGITAAMVLGDKKNISPLLYRAMMQTGTVHLLVVSGFNTGIVAYIFVLALRLFRITRPWRCALASGVLVLYCFVTGAATPVVRATVMAMVFMFAYFIRREVRVVNSCALAAQIILAFNPTQLFEIGFQLSFASVLAIAYWYPWLKRIFMITRARSRLIALLAENFLVSLAAWLGTMGFIWHYFKLFSPITVFANIVMVPLAAFLTITGFILMGVSFILPALIPYVAAVCEAAVVLLLQVNFLLLRIPGASFSFAQSF